MTDTKSATAAVADDELTEQLADIEYTGRKLGPTLAKVVAVVAFTWSLFQLWIASPLPFIFGVGILVDVPKRAIFLAFSLFLCFLIFPASRGLAGRRISPIDIVLAVAACLAALYLWLNYGGLVSRQGVLLDVEIGGLSVPIEAIIGGIGMLLLLEATRRSIGIPLVIVASVFLIYSIFGQSMPEIISHKGVSLERLIGYQWLGAEAIFGIPIDVAVSFVFLFVLFGALLEQAGAGQYFLDLSFAMVGRLRGGPAKAAILASGMTGAISGSSIANVVTTGTFTIPVMKRMGMPAVKAGAIEVAASTNGQIMPPIMGAAAFIIAELIGISYFEVVKAAAIPAVISYVALLYISHLEALKLGLKGLPKSEIPPFLSTLLGGLHYLIPIAVLVYLLMIELWTASTAVFYSLIWLMLIIVGAKVFPKRLDHSLLVVPFAIPVLISAVLRWGLGFNPQSAVIWGVFATIGVVVILAAVSRLEGDDMWPELKSGLSDVGSGMIAGARNMITIGVAVATAGIIVGSVSSTGLNNAMVGVVEAISGGNVYILLVLTAVLCLILGMGLPTTANYLVVASLLAGVLVELGSAAGLVLPLIAVHLFVFYFGLLADSTPPVCLAAFAASAISRADPLKTGVQSFLYDIRTAVLPFVFIFNPELLLIDVGSFAHGVLVVVMALIAILSFSSATQGWLIVKVKLHEAILLLVVSLALFRPGFFMDLVYPPYLPVDIERFATNDVEVDPGRLVRLHVTRETDYGERFKLFVMEMPAETPEGEGGPFGVMLEREEDGRYAVVDLAINGLAETAGLDFGDYITAVDTENLGQPPKQLVYPFGLLLLGLVVLMQWTRWRRERLAAQGAETQA